MPNSNQQNATATPANGGLAPTPIKPGGGLAPTPIKPGVNLAAEDEDDATLLRFRVAIDATTPVKHPVYVCDATDADDARAKFLKANKLHGCKRPIKVEETDEDLTEPPAEDEVDADDIADAGL